MDNIVKNTEYYNEGTLELLESGDKFLTRMKAIDDWQDQQNNFSPVWKRKQKAKKIYIIITIALALTLLFILINYSIKV